MYKIEIIEHFEDWYVCNDTIGEFNTMEEAINCFCEECRNIVKQKYSTRIDYYITENYDIEVECIDEWSMGIMVEISEDGERIASRHFDYDYKSHTFSHDSKVEIEDPCLNSEKFEIATCT